MREKKFRAWDGARMHYWDSVVHPYTEQITGTPYPKLFYLPMSYLLGDGNDMVWLQYTGLKDKNGKEIYEGDIVNFGEDKVDRCTVHFRNGAFCADNGALHFINFEEHPIEVIGNIYENPELLQPDAITSSKLRD